MNDNRELILRIDDAEIATLNAVNSIIQEYSLPLFLFEHIIDKIHRQVLSGKNDELSAARTRAKTSKTDAEYDKTAHTSNDDTE